MRLTGKRPTSTSCASAAHSLEQLDRALEVLEEQKVRDIYLKLGFRIVKRLEFGEGRGMLLYEMPAEMK